MAINLENMENSGNVNFVEKPGKLEENSKYVTSSVKMYSNELFSLKLLREKSESALEISGNLVYQKCGHPE